MSRIMQWKCIAYAKMLGKMAMVLAIGGAGLSLIGCGAGLLPVLTGTGGFIAGAANSSEDGVDGQDGLDGADGEQGIQGIQGEPGEVVIVEVPEPPADPESPVTSDSTPLLDKPGLGLGRDNPNGNHGEGNPDHGRNDDHAERE